ncbi:MAG TPA: HD domain-containing phosphohydrolase [Vicinamibacteria bacterium]|nr:HD domain-containing phosphohydrolase [Vicinamibacteria bacterium]
MTEEKEPAPPRRRRRILSSLLLLLLGVGTVPLLGTAYDLVNRSRGILEVNQKQIQLDKARSLSRQVAGYVQSLRSQVRLIAQTLELEGGSVTQRVQRMREHDDLLAPMVGEKSDFVYVSVADAAGLGAQYGISLSEPGLQRMLQQGFSWAMEGKAEVSHPVFSTALQEPVVVLCAPVSWTKEKGAQGVVLAIGTLVHLSTWAREMSESGLWDVYVVDDRGHLIAHRDKEHLVKEPDVSNLEIVHQFLASKGVGASVPFSIPAEGGAIKMLGTYTRVPDDSDWGVIVQVDEDKAYFDAHEMWRRSVRIVGLVTVVAIVLGTLFAGEISRPIQILAQGARRLAGGDYDTRVKVKSHNEVGVLADAFNQMGDEIQKAFEEIRRQALVNKELFMGSIRMLANAIDEKDPYTRGHSERVAYYSMVLAKHLGMSAEEVDKVHLSGIIHDVGKIGIEDKILRKAAALTEEEYEIMKQHPSKGEHILDGVPLLKEMAGAGLMHHENMDGSGYPRGLRGEEIPLLGRIVSVADAFDAMTTDRPYSKAMTFEAAIARLRFLAGKKFDPGCVEAFEKAHQAGDVNPAKARLASVASRQPARPAEPEAELTH